jgi:hypothetical protein
LKVLARRRRGKKEQQTTVSQRIYWFIKLFIKGLHLFFFYAYLSSRGGQVPEVDTS